MAAKMCNIIWILTMFSTFVHILSSNINTETCVTFEPCPFWQFACASHGCINMRRFCDGNRDCPDGSDENLISEDNYHGNNEFEFPCNNLLNHANLTCALRTDRYACDGTTHCVGQVDESYELCEDKNRYMSRCDEGVFCENNKVLECSECLDEIDLCKDGVCESLTADPEHLCTSSIFRCASDGKCLKASQFCDGNEDCDDGSDEITSSDANHGILCKNNWNFKNKTCFLSSEYICDGITHCENRADECGASCAYSFICENGKCIPSKSNKNFEVFWQAIQIGYYNNHFKFLAPFYFGNGMDDCGDGSEESKDFRFDCLDELNTSLPYEKFCDGVKDCSNGADEMYFIDTSPKHDGVFCQNKYLYNNLTCLIPKDHHSVCDNKHVLCKDFIDERDCPDESDQKYFQCANGDYIHSTGDTLCNFVGDCCDFSDECFSSCNDSFHCLSDNKCLPFEKFCDGFEDCADGSDEITMGSFDGVMCSNWHNNHWGMCKLPERFHCDGIQHCQWRVDECTSGCSESFVCEDGALCIERRQFCDGAVNCLDGLDERYNDFGFKCAITRKDEMMGGEQTRVCVLPQIMLNDTTTDCDDDSDEIFEDQNNFFTCMRSLLRISLRQQCDGVIDCPDLSDECLCEKNLSYGKDNSLCSNLCLSEAGDSFSCEDCSYGDFYCDGGSKCISSNLICDGVFDCTDKLDESYCPKTLQEKGDSEDQYDEMVCPDEEIKFALKCDGKVECKNFADECADECNTTVKNICSELELHPDYQLYHCNEKPVVVSMVCDGVEDCIESPRPEGFNISWNSISVDEKYCPHQFVCNFSRPKDRNLVSISMYKKCDGNIDCEMAEDEAQETCGHLQPKRFYCENAKKRIEMLHDSGFPISKEDLFVAKNKMFDGKKDCSDGSDECPMNLLDGDPIASRYRLIKVVHVDDAALSGIVWLMAILALVGNLFVVWHTVNTIICRKRLSSMMKTNCILVLNLALSDLLMGIYLLDLAIQNTTTSGRYCHVDREWRSGIECKMIGTLAMISIQCSVLILMILTTYRVLVVLRPFSADSMKCRYAGALVASAWVVSTLLACLPHSSMLQYYFTSAAWISPTVEFFETDVLSIDVLRQFVMRLASYQNITDSSILNRASHPAETIEFWKQAYPDTWPHFEVNGLFGFYSSNSVCLPQMFVTVNDVAWGYSFGIVAFDFVAFFYILLSYIIIYHDATRIVANCRNNDENKTMQARITRLVLTDFLCWMPVCFMAFLSLAGVTIPPVAYAFAAIILLPINSALNPILYSNIISVMHGKYTKRWTDSLQRRVERGRKSISRVRQDYFPRPSNAGLTTNLTMTTNDACTPADGTPLLDNAPTSVASQNCSSVSTATTRI